jgi:dTDP-4-amino-4,6-dideoxygalactose transaminase
MIFQAVGAWYKPGDVWRHLCVHGRESDRVALIQQLGERYHGTATLYHKGRAALAEAVRIATGGSGEVAVSGLTCYSLIQAVEAAGCTPVYVDIREKDLHFSAKELTTALKKHPHVKAMVVQNMLGLPADIAGLEKLAKKQGIAIIEDLAHSAGARYTDGREVGTVGDVTILSFGRDKALDVVNGGALIVRGVEVEAPTTRVPMKDQFRDRLYPLIAAMSRLYYPVGKYMMAAAIRAHVVIRSADGEVDVTQTMPKWQARLALRQVQRLDATVEQRRTVAALYEKHLAVPVIAVADGASPIRVPLLHDTRDMVVQRLMLAGVQANDIWYDTVVSPHRYLYRVDYPADECPVAVRVAVQLLNVPTHQRMTEAHVKKIAAIINKGRA